jgi:hypothetical protein
MIGYGIQVEVLLFSVQSLFKVCQVVRSIWSGADGSKYTRSTWKGGRYLGSWYVTPQIQLMIGVTLYCMLTGKLPFNVENPIDLFEAVKTQEYVYGATELRS